MRDGFICKATIVSADKGKSGSPGMLQGAFDTNGLLGTVTKNTACGIFWRSVSAAGGGNAACGLP